MSHNRKPTSQGDALARRHIAHWRRITAKLQVLMNAGSHSNALAAEAFALSRQCERLAGDLAKVAHQVRQAPDSTGGVNQ